MSIEVAEAAVVLLTPYLTEAGREAAKTIGKETAGTGIKLLHWMHDKLTGGAKEALKKLEEQPDSQTNQEDFHMQLAKLLKKEPALVPQLHEFLSQAQSQSDIMNQNVGAGGKASQIKGNQNRVSLGGK